MKVAFAEPSVVDSSGVQRTRVARIKASAHAFQMLSSGLYSDKIAAVLREIGCNAHDAHLANGTKKPFLVKLPTRLDNQFYIKDWGIGLDDKEMEGFSDYFESTKQNSNIYTGAFGLGSKSPFSYAETFTITAVKNGRKRVYTAHLNDFGEPTTSLMYEGDADADWQNGVMVGFPVRPDDFDKFRERAFRIFRFFDPFPDIIGGVTLKAPTFAEDHGSYAFLSDETATEMSGQSSSYYNTKFNWLKMGNVVYPLKLDNLTFASGQQDPYAEAVKSLSNLLVRVDIGDVKPAGSREELQYDDNTKRKILDIVSVVPRKTVESLVKEFKALKTYLEYLAFRKKLEDIRASFPLTAGMFQHAGLKKEDAETLAVASHYPTNFSFPTWDEDAEGAQILHLERSHKQEFQIKIRRADSLTHKASFYPNEKTVLMVADSKNPYGRARFAIKSGAVDNCILVMKKGKNATDADVQRGLDKIRPILMEIEEQPTSKYELAKKKKRANPRIGEYVEVDNQKIQLDDLPPEQKVYVFSSRRTAYKAWYSSYIFSNRQLSRYDVQTLWRKINEMQPILGDVPNPHVFTERQVKKFKLDTLPEWSSFEVMMKDKLEEKKTVKAIQDLVTKDKFIVDLRYGSASSDLVVNLVYLGYRKPAAFKEIRPILQTHGLLKVVEEVLDDSVKALTTHKSSDVESLLQRYKELCELFGAAPSVPQSKKTSVLTVGSKFKTASKLNYDLLAGLADADTCLLGIVLDTQLKKG